MRILISYLTPLNTCGAGFSIVVGTLSEMHLALTLVFAREPLADALSHSEVLYIIDYPLKKLEDIILGK